MAARSTNVYVRHIRKTGAQDHNEEAKLSVTWTELGFRLTDLGLSKLAKRCEIKGRYWSNPNQFEGGFLDKADIGLKNMERLARQMLAEIGQ